MLYDLEHLVEKRTNIDLCNLLIVLGVGPIAFSLIFDIYFDWGWYALCLWLIFSGWAHKGTAKKEYQKELDYLVKLYGNKSSS